MFLRVANQAMRTRTLLPLSLMSFARLGLAFLSSPAVVSRVVARSGIQKQTCARTVAAAAMSTVATGKPSEASVSKNYEELCKALREVDALEGVMGLLGWDEQVMMPDGAASSRAKMKAATAGVLHEKKTDAKLSQLIDELSSGEALSLLKSDMDRANIRIAKKDRDIQSRKSKELASKEAELEARGYQTWVSARQADDFDAFAPVLSEILQLKTDIAKSTRPDLPVYDANIDPFEPGMSAERLEVIFSELRAELVPLLQEVMASAAMKQPVPEPLEGGDKWKVDAQVELCKEISKAIGFDYSKGRMDVSVHPFTGGSHPTDVRITTRYSTDNWLEGVAGTVHEVGHALYEQGRSQDYDGLPVSKALGMGAHESQSLLWERMVFQGLPFWKFATPIFHRYFPHTKDMTHDDFYRLVNRVSPGLIRVAADELTYPLHIILRFELERALFKGEVEVKDLPAEWNRRMKDMLGVDVPSNKEGVLQDVHWGCGAIGYFPSYTLGAMVAAQLYRQAVKEMPNLEEEIAAGRFSGLREWLRVKVHEVGSLHESVDELLLAVTGQPLRPAVFVDYLRSKYRALAGLTA